MVLQYTVLLIQEGLNEFSHAQVQSFNEFKMFLISCLETGVRINELIYLSFKYLSSKLICSSNYLDTAGPISTKMS